jgi:methionyl-tRNA formyltransferase
MNLIFAGTPEFARVALAALHRAGFEIALVLTQPDRPAGRGMKLQASPVKQFAQEKNITVAQPRSLRLDGKYPGDAAAAQALIHATQADAMIVAAYGLILPQWVLNAPRLGCLNIHASLLPRWRGAAPIHRAIEAGDHETGITVMQMDAGLDTGDMLLMEKLPIIEQDSTPALHDKLATLGGRLIVEALELAACGGLKALPQPEAGVSYAHKIDKAESAIDWQLSANAIARKIRAFQPSPGCSAVIRGESIKICAAAVCSAAYANYYEINSKEVNKLPGAGAVLAINSDSIDVQCGRVDQAPSVLRITELQRAGGKRLAAAEFLRGFALQVGERLE